VRRQHPASAAGRPAPHGGALAWLHACCVPAAPAWHGLPPAPGYQACRPGPTPLAPLPAAAEAQFALELLELGDSDAEVLSQALRGLTSLDASLEKCVLLEARPPGQRPAGTLPVAELLPLQASPLRRRLLVVAQWPRPAWWRPRCNSSKHSVARNAAVRRWELRRLLAGPYDAHSAVLTINAGAGGVDAMDWAEMMERMYTRWAADQVGGVFPPGGGGAAGWVVRRLPLYRGASGCALPLLKPLLGGRSGAHPGKQCMPSPGCAGV